MQADDPAVDDRGDEVALHDVEHDREDGHDRRCPAACRSPRSRGTPGPVVISDPMYGMKPTKIARTASGSASGIPRMVMIRNWVAAPKSEMAPVPIMYPPSTSNARLPAASTCERRPGSTRSRKPRQNVSTVAHEVERQEHREEQRPRQRRPGWTGCRRSSRTIPTPNVWTSVTSGPRLPAEAVVRRRRRRPTAWSIIVRDGSGERDDRQPDDDDDRQEPAERRPALRPPDRGSSRGARARRERRQRRGKDDTEDEREDDDRDLDRRRDGHAEQADARRAAASSTGPDDRARSARAGCRRDRSLGSTPRTETTAPTMASAKATTGMATNRPIDPGDRRARRKRQEGDGGDGCGPSC